MQEMQVWSLGRKDPLEEESATYSSVLARRIPWTEKPGEAVNLKLLDILNFLKRKHKCEFVYKISKVRTF